MEINSVPDIVSVIITDNTVCKVYKAGSSIRITVSPSITRVIVVIGEVAVLDEPVVATVDIDTGIKVGDSKIPYSYIVMSFAVKTCSTKALIRIYISVCIMESC